MSQNVMLNLVHLTKLMKYQTLNLIQGMVHGGQKRLSAETYPKSTSKYIDKPDWNLVFL